MGKQTHGFYNSSTYQSWKMMKARCQRPTYDAYQNYGGRGITVCDAWQTFEGFLADMGERPKGTSLDRIDVDGNYEPSNCKWATKLEQVQNMRKNLNVTFNGETHCLAEWSRITGINPETLRGRYHRGWSPEQILEK